VHILRERNLVRAWTESELRIALAWYNVSDAGHISAIQLFLHESKSESDKKNQRDYVSAATAPHN
jgi:hypothetical protein